MSFSYVTFFPLFLQEIVGETSFTINGNEAQTFHWKGFGFKLHVPKNAFHPRSSNCTIIYVKAFLPNSYLELPENTELVSAIYYISMPSPITFKKGVEIEIQHCCKLVEGNQEKLNFVTSTSAQWSTPSFTYLGGGHFYNWSPYGRILLHRFSWYYHFTQFYTTNGSTESNSTLI